MPVGDHLPESGPDPLKAVEERLQDRMDGSEIGAQALAELELEAREDRGPLLTERFSFADLVRMPAEEQAEVLSEFEEQAALAAIASGEVVEAGLGELGEGEESPVLDDDLDLGDEEEFEDGAEADDRDEYEPEIEDRDEDDGSDGPQLRRAIAERDEARRELERREQQAQELVQGPLAQLCGYVVESNGRFAFQNLEDKVVRGRASRAEIEQWQTMKATQDLVMPVAHVARHQVVSNFNAAHIADLEDMARHVGMTTEEVAGWLRSGNRYKDFFEAGRRMGRAETGGSTPPSRARREHHRGDVAARRSSPRTSSSSVSNQMSARSAEYQVPSYGASGSFLDAMADPDFDRRVMRGELVGVDLSRL